MGSTHITDHCTDHNPAYITVPTYSTAHWSSHTTYKTDHSVYSVYEDHANFTFTSMPNKRELPVFKLWGNYKQFTQLC